MKFAVIGNPIGHSLSPAFHNWIFRELGIDAEYQKIEAYEEDMPKIAASLRSGELNGINVTLPHKQAIVPFLDELDHHALTIGAVNCVVISGGQLNGYNTDWSGFAQAMKANGVSVQGKDCLILGAGGAARAVAYALAQSEPASVTITNRTPKKADSLASWVSTVDSSVKVHAVAPEQLNTLAQLQVVINCTSLGMSPHSEISPFTSHDLGQYHLLVDTVYSPPITRFLSDGSSAGARTVGGLDMFIYQGLASLDLWFPKP
ncbi:MAG: shikimate dehydrogenase, partial [Kiritimatiellia bacterium]|nr:shikimate dehydrogenase [Kiritimatiellia bacterium]